MRYNKLTVSQQLFKHRYQISPLAIFLKRWNALLKTLPFSLHVNWFCVEVCDILHNYSNKTISLSGPFRLVIIKLYQSEPSVSAVTWKVCNCYLPHLSAPQPNSIVGTYTRRHTHVNRQKGHNQRTCMPAHTYSGQHQREGGPICLHKVHKTCPLVHTDTLCYAAFFFSL